VIANRAIQPRGHAGDQTAGAPQRRRQQVAVDQRHLRHGDARGDRARGRGRSHPRVEALAGALWAKAVEWVDVVKIGRTHLQDATPLTVGQEWSGYAAQLRDAIERARAATAASTRSRRGARGGYGRQRPAGVRRGHRRAPRGAHRQALRDGANKFAAQGSLDAMVASSAALRGLAVALYKVANDLRWLACGPRAGLHELRLPRTSLGLPSCPARSTLRGRGDDDGLHRGHGPRLGHRVRRFAGQLELNVMRPLVADNVLRSARLLADACEKLRRFSVEGAELDRARIDEHVQRSLMLVSALSPVIGYDKASEIAHRAHDEGITLREAALATGYVGAEEFDRVVVPSLMVGDPHQDLGV